jgi:hypothetical protein
VLILGGYVQQDSHDVLSILFGNAFSSTPFRSFMWAGRPSWSPSATACCSPVFSLFRLTQMLPVQRGSNHFAWSLYASFALMISASTRAIGAFPSSCQYTLTPVNGYE